MNLLRSITLLVFLAGFSSKASAQFEKAEVQVSGMTCSMCQMAAEKALKTIGFVGSIKPDLNNNSYILTFKKDVPVNLDLIKKKIRDAGFSVGKLVATFNLNKLPASKSGFEYDGSNYRFMKAPDKAPAGNVNIVLVGNGFVSTADYKKYLSQTSDPSYKTGMSGNEKVYHVLLATN